MDHPNIAWLVESYFESDPASVAFTRDTALSFAAKKARTASDPKMALDYFKIAMSMSGFMMKPVEQPEAPPITPENSLWSEVARLEAEDRDRSGKKV
jgi:hypothetical protein